MILSQNAHLLAVLLAVNFTPQADAHGYLKSPRSRNYYAKVEGKWSGGTESDPAVETCPHCLNIGGTEARCGFVGDHNYDLPPNAVGGIMPAVTQGKNVSKHSIAVYIAYLTLDFFISHLIRLLQARS